MPISQKSFKVFTCSDGQSFSELGSYGKRAKSSATNHEHRITLSVRRREYDVVIAKMLGVKCEMDPKDPALQEDDYTWYEDPKGPWDGKDGLYGILNPLDNESYCPGDIENAAQIVKNVQVWVKALGGLTVIAKLNALKIDKDLL